MTVISFICAAIAFAVLGPVLGCLLAGVDRIITARIQGRVGPPLLQPYYDVRKLLSKERVAVNNMQDFYVAMALLFAYLSGVFFFAGGNFLLVIFILSLSTLFFIMAAYSTRSPYAELGAEREILQVLAYEPMLLLIPVSFYIVTGTFDVGVVFYLNMPVVVVLPLVFVGFLFILTIKLRKSPFDLSYSHHAHQELVKGISTEMSGTTLAMVEIMHWIENILFMAWVGMFVVWGSWIGVVVALAVMVAVYFLEILIDNNFARVKWQAMLKSSWIVTLVLVTVNIVVLFFL